MGVSLAEYVRRLVAADLDVDPGQAVGRSAVFDLGDSGGSDIATEKDKALAEVIDAARHGW